MSYRKIIQNGLWHNNQALVALLGLCPLLAISNTATNALGLGLATIFVLSASNTTVSLFRNYIKNEIRIPIFVLLIASFVTVVELLMQAFFYHLYLILGIFIPLIVTNCAILARAETFASKNAVPFALLDGLMMGLGFAIVLLILGSLRELIGTGMLFANAHLLFGEFGHTLTLKLADYQGNLLAILPPGAFIGLGLLVGLKNTINQYQSNRQTAQRSIAISQI